MEYGNISPEAITAIARETAKILREQLLPDLDLERKKQNAMKRKFVSPYVIEKYGLIDGVSTRQTVVNMIHDGRIRVGEWFKDVSGNYQILIVAIKRLNDV